MGSQEASLTIHSVVWRLDVGSSHPGAEVDPLVWPFIDGGGCSLGSGRRETVRSPPAVERESDPRRIASLRRCPDVFR